MSANKARIEALLRLVNSAAQEAIAEYEKAGGDIPSIESTEFHPLDNAIDQVVLKSAIRILEGACAQICTTLAPPSHTAINLVQVYDYVCIRIVLRENIANILVNYPKGIHVNELSKIVDIDAKKLARLLRLLATRGCFNEVKVDTFANNRLSLMLHSENPVRHMVSLHVEAGAKATAVLYETLKDPRTANSDAPEHCPVMFANNKEGITGAFFDWMRQEDARRESYHRSMRGLSSIMGSLAVLTHFPFEKYSCVVDEALVQSRAVWKRDYPEAVRENRIEFAELNFFTQVPVKGRDIYYLRNIIHDWPDHESALILRNLRQALGPHSRVLISAKSKPRARLPPSVLSWSAPEPMLLSFGVGNVRMYQQDVTMLLVHNAKKRTLQNSLELSTAAGLKLEKVWDLEMD